MAEVIEKAVDERNRAVADAVLASALRVLEERGVPLDVTVDRLTTFAAGAHVSMLGGTAAAACFRTYADRIACGLFEHGKRRH